jgi:hypothetical protein
MCENMISSENASLGGAVRNPGRRHRPACMAATMVLGREDGRLVAVAADAKCVVLAAGLLVISAGRIGRRGVVLPPDKDAVPVAHRTFGRPGQGGVPSALPARTL